MFLRLCIFLELPDASIMNCCIALIQFSEMVQFLFWMSLLRILSGSRLACLLQTVALGNRSAFSLASSAFLASAVSTLALQNLIFPRIADKRDTAFDDCSEFWSNATSAAPLAEPSSHEHTCVGSVCGLLRQGDSALRMRLSYRPL